MTALRGHEKAFAARNRTTPERLAAVLRRDETFGLDRSGRLVVTETTIPRRGQRSVEARRRVAAPANVDVFRLHSRPGSDRTVLLDFDGHTVSGTVWDGALGSTTERQPAFDTDGDPARWSQDERDLVLSVFRRVAEDFAPFDVDVTTEDPGEDALLRSSISDPAYGTRALITPGRDAAWALCANTCGGIAYVGILNAVEQNTAFQPAWVFSHMLLNDAKFIAEAVSHEVGHNAGLWHHGTADAEYYYGHGIWAPIMGVGYYRPLVQWSSGEYPGASAPWQDDAAVMGTYGLAPRADDHGSSSAQASPLRRKTVVVRGVIETPQDRDLFRVKVQCRGPVAVTLSTSVGSPDLDARLALLDAAGRTVAADDPASGQEFYDLATGLGARLQVAVEKGTYHLLVEGVGAGTTSTGYSDYGSLGEYALDVTTCTKTTD